MRKVSDRKKKIIRRRAAERMALMVAQQQYSPTRFYYAFKTAIRQMERAR